MTEVGRTSQENGSMDRHTEQMFNPERKPSSVDTRLSLGVTAVPLTNTIAGETTMSSGSLVGDEAPSSSVTGLATLTMPPQGPVDGNQCMFESPPDHELPPSIPTAADWTTPIMPQNPLFESSFLNVGSTKVCDEGVLRDANSENIVIRPSAAPLGTEGMSVDVDVDSHQLDVATQPSYVGDSQSSQADFNNMYSGGETQAVHEELDDKSPPFAGETQPANNRESFDDMVILQNDTLTGPTMSVTQDDQNVSHELRQGTDAQPLQNSFNAPAFTPRDNMCSSCIPTSYQTTVSTGERETHASGKGPNGHVSIMEVPIVNNRAEFHPVETAGQLGLTREKKEKDTSTFGAQPGLLNENVNGKGKTDEEQMSKHGVAEIGVKDDVTGNAMAVSEQDIQAIKGRKVLKKFGRKYFEGEVVDYDAENQWFKVVYEDGDEEDLELLEVKEILWTTHSSLKVKKKTSHPKGGVNDQQARVLSREQKRTPKKKRSAVTTQKKSQKVKSPVGSKTTGVKRKANSRSSTASAHGSAVQAQSTTGTKRKRGSHTHDTTSSKLELEKLGTKLKSRENKQGSDAKTPRRSSEKRGRGKAVAKNSTSEKKGARHRSASKGPIVEGKVEAALGAEGGDGGEKRTGKLQKIDTSTEDHDTPVGKLVKKDFGGVLYTGVVVKFDKKTTYYKVKYEDGDQEDLELDELKAILVQ